MGIPPPGRPGAAACGNGHARQPWPGRRARWAGRGGGSAGHAPRTVSPRQGLARCPVGHAEAGRPSARAVGRWLPQRPRLGAPPGVRRHPGQSAPATRRRWLGLRTGPGTGW